jgi:ABC-type multidrug transport system fused ATPase/permease subunit
MTETPFDQKVPALPAWRVIWEMMRFRPRLWFIDLLCVALIRFVWQIAPALIMKAFFDMLTGAAQLTFGIWTIGAFALATWIGRVVASYGFYYADVPIFADIPTLLRKNLLRHILRRPGASALPDSAEKPSVVPRMSMRSTVRDLINIAVGIAIVIFAIVLMVQISPWITVMALLVDRCRHHSQYCTGSSIIAAPRAPRRVMSAALSASSSARCRL